MDVKIIKNINTMLQLDHLVHELGFEVEK